MLKVLFASGNKHKAMEIEETLALFQANSFIEVSAAPAPLEVEENGESFQENALLKAKAYYEVFQVPTLADDSGLLVGALPHELGLYTARFGGEALCAKERCELLLSKMQEIKKEQEREAYFICCLCCYISPDEIYFFEGKLEGKISFELRGEGGFGFDPVFIPHHSDQKELTLAERSEWKKENSHRAKSLKKFSDFFKRRF